MTVQRHWYENDSRCIPAHFQPALLLDLGVMRGVDSHRLLRGTALFSEDILQQRAVISPLQYVQLGRNLQRLLDSDDTAFLVGQRLLPGHYGAFSEVLRHAHNLHQMLDYLIAYRAVLFPLLTPRLVLDDHHAYLYWIDASGVGDQARFWLECAMTAVHALSRARAGEKLPWECWFSFSQPRYVEQYWLHLGERVRFDRHVNLMRVPREYLVKPWTGGVTLAGQIARSEADQQMLRWGLHAGFLDLLTEQLQSHIRTGVRLEQAAHWFEMSPATFKRILKKHDTSFQEQLDNVRKHTALYLFQVKGFSNDEVAAYLNFHDSTNFRRSFKRWTGCTPSEIRLDVATGHSS